MKTSHIAISLCEDVMSELWLSLTGVPAEGREYIYSDQSLWTENLRRFEIPVETTQPLSATLFVQPQDKGVFVRGTLSGSLRIPCDRCAEPFELDLAHEFELFEEVSPEDPAEASDLLRTAGGVLELDAAGLLWEQFVLALPEHALCHPDCRGLCSTCGANLNITACQCESEDGDPRLAVLRNLKINQ
ncbi:MAG: hypothetical protein PWQ57_7 [Desulfovibrionales bacterium]|nr:hypothetical protein [Desulfovibrionales bacterium]